MIDSITIRLSEAKITKHSGRSLAMSLYAFPVDIVLTGHLGAGKTTFVQGLAEGLGIYDPVASPTYALEQRYDARQPLIHLDLYRLTPEAAVRFLAETDDHTGVRCIEWADRIQEFVSAHPYIAVHLEEEGDERILTVDFHDAPLPSIDQIQEWRKNVQLPPHIVKHCEAVAGISDILTEHLLADGTIVRRTAVERAGQVHDLLRFLDFRDGASPPPGVTFSDEQRARWAQAKKDFPDMRHEEACAAFLANNGYTILGDIVLPHGLIIPSPSRATIEQKILFYADKRITEDRIVTIQERFREFRERYGKGKETEQSTFWQKEAIEIEHELFPDGPPA